jgi:hypothetical protein
VFAEYHLKGLPSSYLDAIRQEANKMSAGGAAGRKVRRRLGEPEPGSPGTPNASVTVADWQAMVDNAGPFAPLSELRQILQSAPPEAKPLPEYNWLKGFLQGRELHEEFAGVDVRPK